MIELPFSIELVQILADSRTTAATAFFLFASFMGEIEGYVLVTTLIYVAYDKKLAFRLAAIVLVTMSLNHLLKIVIKNPRPFISEGTYAQKWAVSAENATELATEYSTPSGHAMAGAAFYAQLYASVKNRNVRILALAAILLTGLSRPYLGVHYLEDILVGWLIGLTFVLLLMKYAAAIGELWSKLPYSRRVAVVVLSSLGLWLTTIMANGWTIDGQPLAFMGYAGFLTGIVVAHPLEMRHVNFEPRSANLSCRILRYLICVGMVIGTLFALDESFELLSNEHSVFGQLLNYVRHTIAGTVAMFLAPFVFTKLKLAQTARDDLLPADLQGSSAESALQPR